MLPYFPIDGDGYALTMNARALATDCLIEVDDHYRAELALKDAILAADHRSACQTPPATEAMQWEALELLLPNMARHHPHHFALDAAPGPPSALSAGQGRGRWVWTNRLLDAETAFTPGDPASLPLPPLDWLGRQVQEDLLLLDGAQPGAPLVAGHLCFPAGWSLDDKMGRSFLAIHGPVPLFAARIGRSADLLMQRLKPGHPVGRVGWSLTTDGDLDHSPATAARRQTPHEITLDNAGERCFLRLERQTFSRLPRTRAVLFTIHTYRAPVAAVIAEDAPARARRLAAALRAMPPAIRDYKDITPFATALLAYLEARAEASASAGEVVTIQADGSGNRHPDRPAKRLC